MISVCAGQKMTALHNIFLSGEGFSTMFELPENLQYLKETINQTLLPSNVLHFTPSDTKPWESKLGGCPYLKSAEDYPRDAHQKPMMFLAQINLEEMPKLKGFPQTGILQFYIADNDCYGYEEPCKVIYIDSADCCKGVLLTEKPAQLQTENENLPYEKECRITFEPEQMPVSSTVEGFYEIVKRAHKEDEDKIFELLYDGSSRIGGYPSFVQNPVECYETGEKKVLLLQLDCDDNAGLMFGDSGNCQFFISEKDLANLNFTNVFYDWACC